MRSKWLSKYQHLLQLMHSGVRLSYGVLVIVIVVLYVANLAIEW
ncbi:Uncharacterised protein [Klebsiella pneumoniae]|nr:hypothetical protein AZ017_001215 [Klebsiella pneumoniae]SAU68387.1 Uncharacterised protein [Klebsiella pneumoniae]